MKKLLIIILMAHLTGCVIHNNENFAEKEKAKVQIGEQIWQTEVANNDKLRQRGLMFREKLNENEGMIFVFNYSAPHSFWMKNTLIPLDIIWISEDLKVVDVQTLEPCLHDPCPSYQPKQKAKYVLEINAGKFRGKIGDKVKIQ